MRLRHQTYQARSELRYERRRQRRRLQKMMALMWLGAIGAGVWGVTLGRAPGSRQIAWQNDLGGPVVAAPCALEDRVFVSCLNGNLYALDADTGQTLWKFAAVFPLRSSPAAAAGLVVVGGDDHIVYGVDAATGASVWRHVTQGPVQLSPVTDGNRVFVGSDDHLVRALNLRTGELLWQFKTNGPVFASPLLNGGLVYAASLDGYLYAIDQESGRLRWRYQAGASIYSSPALSGERVGFGCDDHRFYVVEASTGKEVAVTKTQAAIRAPVQGGADGFLVGGRDGKLRFFDPAGIVRWEYEAGAAVLGQPATMNGFVLVGTEAGSVHALDSNRQVIMEIHLGGRIEAGVVVTRGLAIVPAMHGGVFALRLEATQ